METSDNILKYQNNNKIILIIFDTSGFYGSIMIKWEYGAHPQKGKTAQSFSEANLIKIMQFANAHIYIYIYIYI